MSDIIDTNDGPDPLEASQVAAFGGEATQAAAVEVPAHMPRRTIGQMLRGELGFLPVLLTLLVIVVYFQIVTGGIFLKPENLSSLVGQIAYQGILGLGVILVLLLGEIDLSLASVAVLCSVVMAVLSERAGAPAWVAILGALLAGAVIGFINGFFVALLRVPSFIVTLAGSIGYAGRLLHLLAGHAALIILHNCLIAISRIAPGLLPNA